MRLPIREPETRVRDPFTRNVRWYLASGAGCYALCGLWSYDGRERSVRYPLGMN